MADLSPPTTELTAEELQEAVTLAFDLQHRDVERRSAIAATEELGIQREYLTRAIAIMMSRREEAGSQASRSAISLRNIGLGVLAVIALGAIILPLSI
jgi:hypothetical protein